jgi:DNA helicase MCM8
MQHPGGTPSAGHGGWTDDEVIKEVWALYFSSTFESAANQTQAVKLFVKTFREHGTTLFPKDDCGRADYGRGDACLRYPELQKAFSFFDDFGYVLCDNPSATLPALSMALAVTQHGNAPRRPDHRRVHARIVGLPRDTHLADLKSHSVGKLISVSGNVARASTVRPLVMTLPFTCGKCGDVMVETLEDGRFDPPTSCPNRCKSAGASMVIERREATTTDYQRIKVQEGQARNKSRDPGSMPRTIECELFGDLVDACVPGDVATVVGVVKKVSMDDVGPGGGRGTRRGAPKTALFCLQIEAVSVEVAGRGGHRKSGGGGGGRGGGTAASSGAGGAGGAGDGADGGEGGEDGAGGGGNKKERRLELFRSFSPQEIELVNVIARYVGAELSCYSL